jgi:hypothetical protein
MSRPSGLNTKKDLIFRMARTAPSVRSGEGSGEAERGIENCVSRLCSLDYRVTVPCQISTTAQMLHSRHNNLT